jgi:uncharacterized membrane protein
MGKGALQNKAHINKNSNSAMIEQNIVVDDSLLPTAEELAKLQQLDPNIMDWMKERCSIEQNAKIEFNKDRVRLTKKDMGWFHFNNFMSMVFVFFVAIVGLVMSYILITKDYTVVGSIFGASGLAIMLFSMRKSSNSK